ncbi:MAG: hypothetical protein HOW73_07140 [Polyangiaceae bacterium]|nr:hypothetical protein [Polyangiaceae bacterium]
MARNKHKSAKRMSFKSLKVKLKAAKRKNPASVYSVLSRKHTRRRLTKKTVKHKGEEAIEAKMDEASASTTGITYDVKPWGKAKLTYSAYMNQIMVSTRNEDYPKSTGKDWAKYIKWAAVLDKHGEPAKVAQDIVAVMTESPTPALLASYTDNEKRAAAALMLVIAAAEEWRIDGNRKAGRAALRMIADGKLTFTEAFGDDAVFGPAMKGGTAWQRALFDGLRKPTDEEDELADYLSSSDEEDDDEDEAKDDD